MIRALEVGRLRMRTMRSLILKCKSDNAADDHETDPFHLLPFCSLFWTFLWLGECHLLGNDHEPATVGRSVQRATLQAWLLFCAPSSASHQNPIVGRMRCELEQWRLFLGIGRGDWLWAAKKYPTHPVVGACKRSNKVSSPSAEYVFRSDC